ncbi:MAG: monofunctional biosynthetic peptidoglycan transglycosylase [Flavobacteriales bacterium]|jgi:monofunctional biosynthetic peptidoglycan transglycosylase|nr:monofunctional biosynthetic peptidoglycan transglycosylase [Flavobacteriales bacterium]MCI1752504.1 monofunctional biosynthetic peptidoglycan transglycosylase [Flavobacteriales bacterium]
MIRRSAAVLAATVFWSVVVCVLWVLLLRFIPPPVTWEMAAQAAQQDGITRKWVPLNAISPAMPLAVIASEDQLFMEHHGFDIEAMRKAIDHNEQSKKVRGASTISQQTAKNVFLWPGRTYLRKGLEAWFTVLIEALWPKERILEMYLNVAETGLGRFGVEATARQCFRKPASTLSREQAALIAAVLPSPRRFDACKPSAYVRKRQAWVLRQMGQLGDVMALPTERKTK